MAKVGVTLNGLDALQKALKKRADLGPVKKIVLRNGAELTAQGQRNAPVKTGDLKGSITQDIRDAGLTSVSAPHIHYGAYVELGTRFMSGWYYMRRAYNVQKPKFISEIEGVMK